MVQANRRKGEDQLQGSAQGARRLRRKQADEIAIPRSMIVIMQILEHISLEAELVPPTKEEAYELFDEFNDRKVGKMEEYLEKEEF